MTDQTDVRGKIVVKEWLSLDGIIDANTMDEWYNPYHSDARGDYITAGLAKADVLVLGRASYETLAPYWSQLKSNEMGIADKLNTMPKYVISSVT